MQKNPKFEISDKVIIYENLSKKEYQDLMSRIKHIRILVCSDGTVYAWDGYAKTHEDIMRALGRPGAQGFNLGRYQDYPDDIIDIVLNAAKKNKKRCTAK
jgi:hypothetical protein